MTTTEGTYYTSATEYAKRMVQKLISVLLRAVADTSNYDDPTLEVKRAEIV